MKVTTVTSSEFIQNVGDALSAPLDRPVLLPDEQYLALVINGPSLLDVLAQQDAPDFKFEPPRVKVEIVPPTDVPLCSANPQNADFAQAQIERL